MIKELRDHYLPCVVIVYRPPGEHDFLLTSLAPFTRNLNAIGGKATAYICTGHTCAMPTTEPHQVLALLGSLNEDK
jgi:hypothetical protein